MTEEAANKPGSDLDSGVVILCGPSTTATPSCRGSAAGLGLLPRCNPEWYSASRLSAGCPFPRAQPDALRRTGDAFFPHLTMDKKNPEETSDIQS
ncbi:hypothetical protein E4U13_000424 [Claviceps humidiphila]|uniref:Uncharacterized protein n=1 Tax=Claviceps humidiphila TaxID=1294629 RepID=A0A9P7Q8F2_9HYPO|nr:hypothetical protein E4U13_000424 [Claviceps humidiphila]